MNLLRKEKFQSYYDSNTNCLHLPVKRFKKLNAEQTKPTPYPVTVLAGQFATDFKKYTMEGSYSIVKKETYKIFLDFFSDFAPSVQTFSMLSDIDSQKKFFWFRVFANFVFGPYIDDINYMI